MASSQCSRISGGSCFSSSTANFAALSSGIPIKSTSYSSTHAVASSRPWSRSATNSYGTDNQRLYRATLPQVRPPVPSSVAVMGYYPSAPSSQVSFPALVDTSTITSALVQMTHRAPTVACTQPAAPSSGGVAVSGAVSLDYLSNIYPPAPTQSTVRPTPARALPPNQLYCARAVNLAAPLVKFTWWENNIIPQAATATGVSFPMSQPGPAYSEGAINIPPSLVKHEWNISSTVIAPPAADTGQWTRSIRGTHPQTKTSALGMESLERKNYFTNNPENIGSRVHGGKYNVTAESESPTLKKGLLARLWVLKKMYLQNYF